MTLTISVYSKNGCCCKGDPINTASFRAVSKNSIVYFDTPLSASNGGPLSGGPYNVYTVVGPLLATPGGGVARDDNGNPIHQSEFWLRVHAPYHNDWDFYVLDGETHEVWLSKAP